MLRFLVFTEKYEKNKMDKDDEDNKEEEEDMDKKGEQDEEFFFAKILKMTKYTSLPNLVRLGQWEQVSEYIHTTYYYILTGHWREYEKTRPFLPLLRPLKEGWHFKK